MEQEYFKKTSGFFDQDELNDHISSQFLPLHLEIRAGKLGLTPVVT
jgi:hypothetical protein